MAAVEAAIPFIPTRPERRRRISEVIDVDSLDDSVLAPPRQRRRLSERPTHSGSSTSVLPETIIILDSDDEQDEQPRALSHARRISRMPPLSQLICSPDSPFSRPIPPNFSSSPSTECLGTTRTPSPLTVRWVAIFTNASSPTPFSFTHPQRGAPNRATISI
jgi:hypothetical protein